MGCQVDWDALLLEAWGAREKAYAPYSGLRVGASFRTDSGDMFYGCNIENGSLGLTTCVERPVVAAAVLAGFHRFVAIGIAAETDAPIPPRGPCRQVLAEFNPLLEIRFTRSSGIQIDRELSFRRPSPFFKLQRG